MLDASLIRLMHFPLTPYFTSLFFLHFCAYHHFTWSHFNLARRVWFHSRQGGRLARLNKRRTYNIACAFRFMSDAHNAAAINLASTAFSALGLEPPQDSGGMSFEFLDVVLHIGSRLCYLRVCSVAVLVWFTIWFMPFCYCSCAIKRVSLYSWHSIFRLVLLCDCGSRWRHGRLFQICMAVLMHVIIFIFSGHLMSWLCLYCICHCWCNSASCPSDVDLWIMLTAPFQLTSQAPF